jgi:hypothetical protein
MRLRPGMLDLLVPIPMEGRTGMALEFKIKPNKLTKNQIHISDILNMIMSCHPNSGQNQNIRIANESFENVAKFKYLGMTLINKNIYDEIKIRLNSRNACYCSVQNLLSSRLI